MSRMRSSLLTLSLLLLLPACQRDPASPEYWQDRLERATRTPDRARVVEALRTSGRLSPSFLPLLHGQLAAERRPEVKTALARALAQLKDGASVEPLAGALDLGTAEGAGNAMNKEIVHALATIGDRRATPTLLQALRSRDPYVRIAAVEALGSLRAPEAAGPLEAMAADPTTEPFVVKRAIQTLGHIGATSSIPVLVRMMYKERPNVSYYVESSFSLYQVGTPAVAPLLAVLEGKDRELAVWAADNNVREAGLYAKAAQVLGDLHASAAVPALVQRLSYTSEDPDAQRVVRMFAAEALGRLRSAEGARVISGLLDEPAYRVREKYVGALVRVGGRDALPALAKAAATGPWDARELAAAGLVLLGDAREKPVLAQLARGEPGRTQAECREEPGTQGCDAPAALARARQERLAALGRALDAVAEVKDAAGWRKALEHPEARVRERAALELGRLGGAAHVEALAARTREADLAARAAVLQALDWLSDDKEAASRARSALPQLEKQLTDEHGRTQFVVVNEDLRRVVAKLKRA